MEGQTAPKDLATSLVQTIRDGGVVIVVGWPSYDYDPLSKALMASGRVRFTETTPSSVQKSDFVIFTNAVDDSTVNRVKKMTVRVKGKVDERRFTLDGIRRLLQRITDSLDPQLK